MPLKRDLQHGILFFSSLCREGKTHFVLGHNTFFCEGQPGLQILCSCAYIVHPTEKMVI